MCLGITASIVDGDSEYVWREVQMELRMRSAVSFGGVASCLPQVLLVVAVALAMAARVLVLVAPPGLFAWCCMFLPGLFLPLSPPCSVV